MGTVSEHVDESKALVHTIVLLPAMVPKLVLHARLNVMSPAATHDAQRNASSPVPPVRKPPVFPCAHIASAPCPAPLHATTFLVLVGARNFSNADISVLLFVEKSVLFQPTAKFVQRMTSRIGTSIIFLVSHTRMLILM
ncbi:NF-X1 finger and helicase domain protein [Penicillium frequentans]|nr:NF-X1 finger and helicase domain protein [Penicillium glabrum]